jgi:hypothetical protein
VNATKALPAKRKKSKDKEKKEPSTFKVSSSFISPSNVLLYYCPYFTTAVPATYTEGPEHSLYYWPYLLLLLYYCCTCNLY